MAMHRCNCGSPLNPETMLCDCSPSVIDFAAETPKSYPFLWKQSGKVPIFTCKAEEVAYRKLWDRNPPAYVRKFSYKMVIAAWAWHHKKARELFDARPHHHPNGLVPDWTVQPQRIKDVFYGQALR